MKRGQMSLEIYQKNLQKVQLAKKHLTKYSVYVCTKTLNQIVGYVMQSLCLRKKKEII